GSVRLWDLETGEMLKRLDGHEGIVIRVAFSPDGRTALSTSLDHTIIWWDLDSGEIIHRFAGYYANDAGGIKFLNNRQAVAAAPSGSTYILDLDSNWLLEHWPGKHQAPINGLAISHDGTIAVSAAGAGEAHLPQDNTLIVWDYQTGESLQQLVGHEDPVLTVAFLPDDTQLLSGDRGGKLILWDLQTGKPVREYVENNSSAVALAVSSDGKYAAVATQAGQVVYWHLQSGLALRRFTGAMTPIRMTDVAFTVDDQHVLAASADNTVLIWDVKSGEQLMRLTGFHGGVGSPFTTQYSMEDQLISRMAVGSDGRTILTVGAYDRVLLWDLQTGQAIRSFVGHRDFATDAAMSSDGRRALTSDGGKALILWDVATGDPIRQHRISNTYTPFGIVNENTNQVAIHPSGQTALTSEPDGSILKWQLADPSPMELMDWLAANRELRELTCLERRTFQIEPLCVDGVAGETTAGLLTAVRHSLQTLVIPTQETAEAPQPAFQLPAQPPRPTRVAQLGENRGELVANDFDVWTYDGKAGELLTLRMVADNPANDPTIPFDGRRAAGVLDPFLFVIAPDSTKLAMGDDDLTTDGTRLSDAFLNAVLLPEDGQYRIEARSFLDDGEGGYTLLIESGAVTVDVDILRDYEGVYLEGPWEFDIVVHVEDGTLYLDTLQTGTSDKLIPLSDNEFVMAGDGSIFVFVRNEAGVVTRYEIWPAAIHPVSGHWYPAEKVGELP
ncbi:MAG: PQQ-binding-like beta-propeller repeat protein, partial [Anaerolineales bacterium]|nr:PQQ-binding-like beta-propeller repeat protein [Anaerolineales bacterium]